MSFLSDIEEIRARARQKIENGPVTPNYALNRDDAIGVLNEALATEIVCVPRYRLHYYMARASIREHATEEQGKKTPSVSRPGANIR